MLARLLCLLLLAVLGPSATALADCCEADRSCCAGEAPACPVQPGGECSFTAAHPIAPVAELRVDSSRPMECAASFASAVSAPPARVAPRAVRPTTPHSFLLFTPLRN